MNADRQRDRAAFGTCLRFSAVTAATAWAAMFSWRGFTDLSIRYLWALVLIGATIAVTSAVGRWRRWPRVLVFVAEVVLGSAMTCVYLVGRPYPNGELWSLLESSVDAANTYASPVPVTETISVQPLLVVGGLAAMLLVELCAGVLQRVPLSGLPLLTVYSVPISLIGDGLSWWVFVLTAVGFLVMLYLQEAEHLSRWGRSLDGAGEPVRRLSDAVRASAVVVGSVATATAVALPLVVPTFDLSVFDLGNGPGGDGDIEITNPMLDLRKDLVRGDDIPLVRIRTDDPQPDHFRISVLNRFTDNEWSAGDRQVPSSNEASGDLPDLAGVDSSIATEIEQYDYDVDIDDRFDSKWLPTQAPISRISADGDWRYDEETMDFLAGDDDLSTAGLSYDMTALDLDYDDAALLRLDADATGLPDELTDLPADARRIVDPYVSEATDGALSDFAKAVALSQWFRDDQRFTYSLTPQSPEKVGTDELADFLDPTSETGRSGYCEQFAAAMAVMARALGIPSRVAVGFLNPTQQDDGTYVYSAHDLHAWVELYFPGAGWVLFDPTPSDRGTDAFNPGYADAEVEIAVPTDDPTVSETSDVPTSSATTLEPRPSQAPQQNDTADDESASAGAGFPWVRLLIGLGVVVGLVLLVRLPRAVRERQRARRLTGGPEDAWDELRATAIDLGRAWPERRSPRETAALVTRYFGRVGGAQADHARPAHGPEQAPEAVAALERIVAQVEQSRYARHHAAASGALGDDVQLCSAALAAGVTPRVRRRAVWLPRSVATRRPASERRDERASTGPEPTGGIVEHI